MKKKLLSVLIICLSLVMIAACGGAEDEADSGDSGNTGGDNGDEAEGDTGGDTLLAKIKEKGVVKVGFANEAPYAFKNEDGELTGAAVEVARAVFKELGVTKMEGQLADWGQLIPGVKTGKFDVITAGMAINPDRCEQIDFAHPGIVYGEGMVVESGNPLDLHSYDDIAANPDVTVAVMSGATEVEFLKSAGVSEDQIKTYSDIAATLGAVQTGRAGVTTATDLTVKKAMKSAGEGLEFVEDFEQPDVEGVPSYGAAGFSQDSDALREAFNTELDKLKESGKLAEVIKSVDLFGESNVIKEDITTEELCAG
jgi:polar amino acid transport system substrate-binding protein